jgi:hypothetical protein
MKNINIDPNNTEDIKRITDALIYYDEHRKFPDWFDKPKKKSKKNSKECK